MSEDVPWLSDEEQALWRRWLRVEALLPAALHRDLQSEAGLSLADFDVLVRLTESSRNRLRVSELARALQWEKSRLSHHLTRMVRRGLVRREECPDDARGAFVVLTGEGRTAIEQAAPGHVRTVRRLVFDDLDPQEAAALSTVLGRILDRLETPQAPPR